MMACYNARRDMSRERAEEAPLRVVDTTPSLRDMALRIANKSPHLDNLCNPAGVQGDNGNECNTALPAIDSEAAGEIVRNGIIHSLNAGKLVIIDDDARKEITGLRLTEQGLAVEMISRFPHQKTARGNDSYLLPHNIGITAKFDGEGITIDINQGVDPIGNEANNPEASSISIHLPRIMHAGQQGVIAAAEVVATESVEAPVYRDTSYVETFWRLDKETEEIDGDKKTETKQYQRITLQTRTFLHDDGFIFRTEYPATYEVIAVS